MRADGKIESSMGGEGARGTSPWPGDLAADLTHTGPYNPVLPQFMEGHGAAASPGRLAVLVALSPGQRMTCAVCVCWGGEGLSRDV